MPLIPHELEQVGYIISVKDCKTLMFNISSFVGLCLSLTVLTVFVY